tara:strand:- start:793 stop:1416 length:624 start_codon:yes stop_codon:yes gene_type:complete
MIEKPDNWEEITQELKQGPDFIIHGTKKENLDYILDYEFPLDSRAIKFLWRGLWGKWNNIPGSFHGVSSEEKKLEDSTFFDRLWCSVYSSLGYSYSTDITQGELVVKGVPCLLIGVYNTKGSIENFQTGSDTGAETCFGSSFPIGEEPDRRQYKLVSVNMRPDEFSPIIDQVREEDNTLGNQETLLQKKITGLYINGVKSSVKKGST